MKKELMQKALDALTCSDEVDDPGHRCGHCDDYVDRNRVVREALTTALALPDARPVGYLPAYELGRLRSGHNANLKSAKFGPSPLDDDVPVYLVPPQPATAPEPVRLTQADIDAAYFEALGSQHLRPQDKPSVSRFAYAIEKAIHAKASTQ